MEIAEIAALSGAGTSKSIADRKLIADNLDTFLQLLTTQLRHQDPLDPLKTSEFTGQLVQFSQVEQAVKSNDWLEQLVAAQTGSAAQTALGYIGMAVTADGATTALANGEANWQVTANRDARATYTVRNANGSIVATSRELIEAGRSQFTWNGITSTGEIAPPGLYTLGVDARDATGRSVKVSTEISGVVLGADFDGGEPVLDVGGIRVRLSTIGAVRLPSAG